MDSKLWHWYNTSYYCSQNNTIATDDKPDKINGKNADAAAGIKRDTKAVQR
jgi:hypothetical protein